MLSITFLPHSSLMSELCRDLAAEAFSCIAMAIKLHFSTVPSAALMRYGRTYPTRCLVCSSKLQTSPFTLLIRCQANFYCNVLGEQKTLEGIIKTFLWCIGFCAKSSNGLASEVLLLHHLLHLNGQNFSQKNNKKAPEQSH